MGKIRHKIVALCILISMFSGVSYVSAEQPERYVDSITDEYTVTKDIVYSEAEDYSGALQSLKLDVYEPQGDTAVNRPVFIWVHGGNYMFGSKNDESTYQFAAKLAMKGFVALCIDYRLNPKVFDSGDSFNTTVRNAAADCAATVQWVRDNAEEYGMDANKIIVAGYSSGAEIVDNFYFNDFVPDLDRTGIAAVISLSGNRLFWPASEEEETPFGEPGVKCLIIHGTKDNINPVSDIKKYEKQLGDRAVVRMMEGYDHFWQGEKAEELLLTTITDFFKENVTFSEIEQASSEDSDSAQPSDTEVEQIAKTGEDRIIGAIPDALCYLIIASAAALAYIKSRKTGKKNI